MNDREPTATQIDALLASNMQAFENWKSANNAHQTLAIPSDVTDVFIPRRLMELAHDPSRLRTIVSESDPMNLGFMIVESFDEPITDPDKFAKWQEEHPELNDRVVNLTDLVQSAPEGIDLGHVLNFRLVKSGAITLKDKIYIRYYADKLYSEEGHDYSHIVETRNYLDRVDMQRIGVGTSFYERLEDVFKILGFRYLAEDIVSIHPNFFAKSRIRFNDLPDEVKAEFPDGYGISSQGQVMVKLL